MSSAGVINRNTVTKKCGEIIITMKKNTKNIYSFNCWYCDTICLQMKKFTLHLEREHITQLEQAKSNSESNKQEFDDKIEIQKPAIVDEISVGEIKIEDDYIKSEMGEENLRSVTISNKNDELSPGFQDPLETFDENTDEKQTIFLGNDMEDVEMHNFSEENHKDHADLSRDDYSSDYDWKKDDSADEAYAESVKRNTKAKEKKIILALIEEFHNSPQLWNTTLSAKCNLKQKEDLLQNITDALNVKLKIKLKLYMVKKKLNFICEQYEKEIERQLFENQHTNDSVNSELWFFENLSFLKTMIENKFKVKKKKPYHKVKPLNDVVLSDLIDIYKNYNSLWDVNHLAYTVKDKRQEIMQSMLDEIKNKINISLDIYRLEKNLNYIHKSFAKDKQLRLECEVKQQDFQPSCSYFNKCDFLESHQGPFKCSNCNEIIETYNDYQIHKSQHDGSMPFKCQECGMGFNKITNYTIHAKRHLRVFKFHCGVCGKGYPFNAELDRHMRSHTGALPFLCSVCGEGFRTAISYDNHIRRHEERFKYSCHICKKGFNHMTRLNEHVKAHLNVRDIICTVCGKGFTSRKYLNYHKRIHEGKNYSCNICGKSFAQAAGLRAHKKYHGTPIGVSSIQKEQIKYKFE